MGCRGSFCPNYAVEVWICDECGEVIGTDPDDVHSETGYDLCEDCFEKLQDESEEEDAAVYDRLLTANRIDSLLTA